MDLKQIDGVEVLKLIKILEIERCEGRFDLSYIVGGRNEKLVIDDRTTYGKYFELLEQSYTREEYQKSFVFLRRTLSK